MGKSLPRRAKEVISPSKDQCISPVISARRGKKQHIAVGALSSPNPDKCCHGFTLMWNLSGEAQVPGCSGPGHWAWGKESCVIGHGPQGAMDHPGWPQRPCLAPGTYPSPIQYPDMLGMLEQLFSLLLTSLSWPKHPNHSFPLSFPDCSSSCQPFLSPCSLFLLHCFYEHDPQLIFFLPTLFAFSIFFFFFCFSTRSIFFFQCNSHTLLSLVSSSPCPPYLS